MVKNYFLVQEWLKRLSEFVSLKSCQEKIERVKIESF